MLKNLQVVAVTVAFSLHVNINVQHLCVRNITKLAYTVDELSAGDCTDYILARL